MVRTGRGDRHATTPYQTAIFTTLPVDQVLGKIDLDRPPGMTIVERGAHYLLLRLASSSLYGADVALSLGIAVVLALLIAATVTPLALVGLPAALLPSVPLLVDHRPDLAVSAIEKEGITRVTAHGEASAELAAFLDRYLGELPPADGGDDIESS